MSDEDTVPEIDLYSLPYGFQKRIAQLAPMKGFFTFKMTGTKAANLCNGVPITTEFKGNSTQILKEKTCWYVRDTLDLTIDKSEEGGDVFFFIMGRYRNLSLSGTYSWRHALRFFHFGVTSVNLMGDIQIPSDEQNEFAEEIGRVLLEQEISINFNVPLVIIEKIKAEIYHLALWSRVLCIEMRLEQNLPFNMWHASSVHKESLV